MRVKLVYHIVSYYTLWWYRQLMNGYDQFLQQTVVLFDVFGELFNDVSFQPIPPFSILSLAVPHFTVIECFFFSYFIKSSKVVFCTFCHQFFQSVRSHNAINLYTFQLKHSQRFSLLIIATEIASAGILFCQREQATIKSRWSLKLFENVTGVQFFEPQLTKCAWLFVRTLHFQSLSDKLILLLTWDT